MRKDLKTNLSCLITKNGGAGRLDLQENKLINIQKYVYCRKLERCIDNLAETLEKRLEATQVRAKELGNVHDQHVLCFSGNHEVTEKDFSYGKVY